MSKLTTIISRGNILESSHEIKCLIGSINGKIIFSTNNQKDIIYPRSSIKIFQGIPFSTSNAVKLYNLIKNKSLYLVLLIVVKLPYKRIKKLAEKINLKISDLKCGIHNPIHQQSSNNLFLSGRQPRPDL